MKKTWHHLMLCLVLLLSLKFSKSKTSSSLAIDKSSLATLKSHIISDSSLTITTNWSDIAPVCSWIGVTCNLRHQRVSGLNLSDMGLVGRIPAHLGNLSFLVSLDLKGNNFSGTLPLELSHLRRLRYISLFVNNFTGEIPPWIPSLSKLEYLNLRDNSFSGLIPKSISNLMNLKFLDFSSNFLEGGIPAEIGGLQRLQVLSIGSNRLSGTIPSSMFNISSLRRLAFESNELSGGLPNYLCSNLPFIQGIYLGFNLLSGQIPSNLSECSQLEILSLSSNYFSGKIPAAIGDLQAIHSLLLGGNNLTGVLPPIIFSISSLQILEVSANKLSGEISRDIGNLTMLIELFLANNHFTGVIPREIGQLLELQILQLFSNKLRGSPPLEIFNISSLTRLSLTQNDLTGSLPTHICARLPLLESLLLARNHFNGTIPDSISNCSHLQELDLGVNEFTGLIPHSLGALTSLQVLNLPGNYLSSTSDMSFITSLTNCTSLRLLGFNVNPLGGMLPSSVGSLSPRLQQFIAYECGLKGSIPAEIGNLSDLINLSLDDNRLVGNIPSTLNRLVKLQGLDLAFNNITGFITDEACDLQSLSLLSLSANWLHGPIPTCLQNVTSLRQLYLQSNFLNSTVPSGLWRMKDLLELDLSSNSFTGSLPPEFGGLAAVKTINLSMNQLSGSIPSAVGDLQNLESLSLARNRLEGLIPDSFGRITGLVTLDLSGNNLSGSVPKSLEALKRLQSFNVSFNALSGEIPNGGLFLNLTMESFKGNEALCGNPRFGVPACHVVKKSKKKKKVQFALFIVAGVVVFATIVCLGFIFLGCARRKVKASDGIVSVVPKRISYIELSRATQQFNETNLLGMGSFGSVFRGILEDGNAVAVKVFRLQSEAGLRSFDVECEVLRNIRHRNLAKVISSCANEEFKALVLEYMPNGNLEKWLYSHNYFLDFTQRMSIMIDVASALEYLHHGYSTQIVHCDLKPSNVLLDEDMVARVSDFGISKLLSEGESLVITNTLATLGYIAPEYGFEGLVSTRCDVYSYGVMLMETFTRKKPSDDMFAGDLSLKIWIETAITQSAAYRVIDANLLTNVDEEHGDKIVEFASSILKLAVKCCADSPNDRINMKEALAEMHKIERQFSG